MITNAISNQELRGKSTDPKPVPSEGNRFTANDIYIELDTGDAYFWDEATSDWSPVAD